MQQCTSHDELLRETREMRNDIAGIREALLGDFDSEQLGFIPRTELRLSKAEGFIRALSRINWIIVGAIITALVGASVALIIR